MLDLFGGNATEVTTVKYCTPHLIYITGYTFLCLS